jgi:SAM-dependent methyltransferase
MLRLEQQVQKCYETSPFPNILQRSADFEGDIRQGIEWAILNWEALGFDWKVIRPSTVLCAGCGTGEEAIILSRLFPDAAIHAIDISEPSLLIAMQNAKRALANNIIFQRVSILEDLPLLSRKYDLVYCSGVIHHLSEPEIGFGVLLNCVTDSGRMICSLYNTYGLLTYLCRLRFLDILAGNDPFRRIKWTMRMGFHDGKNQATLWDFFVHPQVNTYTIGQVRKWAIAHSRIIMGISPPLSISGLVAYALRGQRFAQRRQQLIKTVLRLLRRFFDEPNEIHGKPHTRLSISLSPIRDVFFQSIFLLLGKGECFYLIQKI